MKKFDTDKYIRKNPAPQFPLPGKFKGSVIIPAYDEAEYIDRTLISLHEAISVSPFPIAVIVVVNHPPGCSPVSSEALLAKLEHSHFPDTAAIYLPDNPGGVGRARKLGMDSFIASLAPEDMENHFIFSLDADTIVEKDYFSQVMAELSDGGAVSIGFSHTVPEDPEQRRAILRYEKYLTRYVDKLREAGSPYAFYTVGSAFAVRCDAYIRAGGMKVRQAGEDFYFLQAVAKSSGVKQMAEILVHPSARISGRVPFGTGPAIKNLLAGIPLNEISDEAFDELKIFLEIATGKNLLNAPDDLRLAFPGKTTCFLQKEGFFETWQKVISQSSLSPEKQLRSFHEWFDGLKTLKFLHFLSDLRNFDIDKKQIKC